MDGRERTRQAWLRLHCFIRNNGGTVTSLPDASPVRFECLPDCDLPEKLTGFGYQPSSVGTTERLMPMVEMVKLHGRQEVVRREHVTLGQVQIWELML